MENQFPRFLIDDTTGLADGRVFIVHLDPPRFVGELFPEGEAPVNGITLAAPLGQTVANIQWIDEPVFDSDELLANLAKAIHHHDSIR